MSNQNSSKLICTTRYSRIQKVDDNVVVKSVKIEGQNAPHDVESELIMLLKCNHPHIIPVLSSQLQKGILEISMPYVAGDLFQFMKSHYRTPPSAYLDSLFKLSNTGPDNPSPVVKRKNKLSMKRTLHIIRQCADAIAYVHSLGIIHRDIKPQNFLIDALTDHIYLIDFGISFDTSSTMPNKYKETAESKIHDVSTSIYKAPELMFSVRNYGAAVDVWSLAVVISQLMQDEIMSQGNIPAFVVDGSEELDAGTDIRAIMSIFQHLGIPSEVQWPQVVKYGSSGFVGMFGTQGDGNYLFEKPWDEQLRRLDIMFPRIHEVSKYEDFAKMLLGMIIFDTDKRSSAAEVLAVLDTLSEAF